MADTAAIVDTLNAGLFPSATGQSHTFLVRGTNGTSRTVTLTSATITHLPVPIVTTFNTTSGQLVGYIQFNDHIATAETPLMNAITFLDNANVTALILDLRYNGGGYLDLASEVAYMIGNRSMTAGRTFEKIVFNDKNPNRNPITGDTLAPTPFHSRTQGFTGAGPANVQLPSLDLQDVYIITGTGHLFGERVHHQQLAGCRGASASHRLHDLRQAIWLLPDRQLRDYLLLHPVPWRECRELRRLHRRFLAGKYPHESWHQRAGLRGRG